MQKLLIQRINSEILPKIHTHRFSTTANPLTQQKHSPDRADVIVIGKIKIEFQVPMFILFPQIGSRTL